MGDTYFAFYHIGGKIPRAAVEQLNPLLNTVFDSDTDGNINIGANYAVQGMHCLDCNKEWNADYRLVHVEEP